MAWRLREGRGEKGRGTWVRKGDGKGTDTKGGI